MKWTDIDDIAIALCEAHANVDPLKVNFVDLHRWVCALPGFAENALQDGQGRSSIVRTACAGWAMFILERLVKPGGRPIGACPAIRSFCP